jgi:hypothetical protein
MFCHGVISAEDKDYFVEVFVEGFLLFATIIPKEL